MFSEHFTHHITYVIPIKRKTTQTFVLLWSTAWLGNILWKTML